MADADPQSSGDKERLLPTSSTCSQAKHMEQPPPYTPTPPLYGAHPSPSPYHPPQEPGLDAGYQCSSEGYPVGEDDSLLVSDFEDKSIRRAFIRKVFCVVTLQLLFTFSVVCVFTFSIEVKKAVQKNIWILLSALIVYLVVSFCLICCRSFSRRHPWNLVGLAVVTVTLSYLVGTVASRYSTPAVVIAMGSTLAISLAVIVFSAQTKVDFTICNGILVALSVNVLMLGFFSIFFYSTMLHVLYGFLGALLFSLFLVVDCQLVMGKQTYSLNPEEYVFAALIIYLDMINIFLYLLILLGGGRR
ncbi:hypothetical protein ACEWY4_006378 [Coilia grayii]|uniref:Uncharacterized protein n=1 Tax=Coilia grayii TaxID=363190 RepID=A0ABD1KDU7_9TELE